MPPREIMGTDVAAYVLLSLAVALVVLLTICRARTLEGRLILLGLIVSIAAVGYGSLMSTGAAMAPVLKQLFRVSGEGVFTDRDQALLLDMVPKRTDLPAAREAKIANIDAIVRAKLGMPSERTTPENRVPRKEAPPQAIEYLKAHPETKAAFFAKYGYLP